MNLNHTPEKAKKGSMNRDKEDIKDRLEEYLEGKGIDTRKPFHCLNPDHDDTHPSMSFYKEGRIVKCYSGNGNSMELMPRKDAIYGGNEDGAQACKYRC
jgi:hypothetical protein